MAAERPAPICGAADAQWAARAAVRDQRPAARRLRHRALRCAPSRSCRVLMHLQCSAPQKLAQLWLHRDGGVCAAVPHDGVHQVPTHTPSTGHSALVTAKFDGHSITLLRSAQAAWPPWTGAWTPRCLPWWSPRLRPPAAAAPQPTGRKVSSGCRCGGAATGTGTSSTRRGTILRRCVWQGFGQHLFVVRIDARVHALNTVPRGRLCAAQECIRACRRWRTCCCRATCLLHGMTPHRRGCTPALQQVACQPPTSSSSMLSGARIHRRCQVASELATAVLLT